MCGHPERIHYAKRMCHQCYMKKWRRRHNKADTTQQENSSLDRENAVVRNMLALNNGMIGHPGANYAALEQQYADSLKHPDFWPTTTTSPPSALVPIPGSDHQTKQSSGERISDFGGPSAFKQVKPRTNATQSGQPESSADRLKHLAELCATGNA
eukprot:TRINITY_DN6846_c0_g1_i9.p2 TRINITY_DN6846_c0_g1~~TRINITY_DN6846_c0_g1_i9.p2  ORF type:complete len:155 (-),score=27.52 TRINITY_DN6846_c0_g1_i9:266-730(-)